VHIPLVQSTELVEARVNRREAVVETAHSRSRIHAKFTQFEAPTYFLSKRDTIHINARVRSVKQAQFPYLQSIVAF
jgi:hypothetical protein